MKIMVVGSGGREHALAWKLSASPIVEKVFCAPGNGGTRQVAENVPLKDTDIAGLAGFAASHGVDLTVVGPEAPLVLGIVDEFEKRGLKIFGPSKKAAELEGSKVFAKQFLERHKIPTGRFKVVENISQVDKVLTSGELGLPVVVKADGLAAGKGVVICHTAKKAEETANDMLVHGKFGQAGKRILMEEFLRGREMSFIVVTDGTNVQPFVTAMDHKTAYDGDKGPNTGGMGAVSPSPYITEDVYKDAMEKIIFPTVTRMLEEGRRFTGALYAGLMLTDKGPKVLEFNCRFGDPETQAQLMRIESDLAVLLMDTAEGNALKHEVRWSSKPSGCVVITSGGYPLRYEKGKTISGLNDASALPGVAVFHAGTVYDDGNYLTNGGRVLDVCASEATLKETMDKVYQACGRIHFEAAHFRRDIGARKEEEQ